MAGGRLLAAYATLLGVMVVENGDEGAFFDLDGSGIDPLLQYLGTSGAHVKVSHCTGLRAAGATWP
eukprot:50847-Rhodomonas_salina.3